MAKTSDRIRVMVFGVFDLLHPGHVAFLESARRRGTELIVVITPDVKAAWEKGRRPFFSLAERMRMVKTLSPVDRVVPGDAGPRWTVIKRLRPDVICIGHDQQADHPEFVRQLGLLTKRPRVVKMKARDPERYSSSHIRLEVRNGKSRG